MKKLLLLLFIAPMFGFGQGEQRYADGTATDQDGNTFEWINYGTQDWAIENAEVVIYRDGTAIPQVTDESAWENLTTGAWCYYDNDSTKGKLYNWYAIAGIHDDDPNTPNKEFAPDGWRVPTDAEWTTLENYLITAGYNFDDNTTENKIAKSMASTTGWTNSVYEGSPGNNQYDNNNSGFNAYPKGHLGGSNASFYLYSSDAFFWSSSQYNTSGAWCRRIIHQASLLKRDKQYSRYGFSVRFVRDASTASTNKYSNSITIYPNPTTSIVTLQGDKDYDIEVYTLQGKKVMVVTGNSINMEQLSTATYIVKATEKSNNEELTYKVVKN